MTLLVFQKQTTYAVHIFPFLAAVTITLIGIHWFHDLGETLCLSLITHDTDLGTPPEVNCTHYVSKKVNCVFVQQSLSPAVTLTYIHASWRYTDRCRPKTLFVGQGVMWTWPATLVLVQDWSWTTECDLGRGSLLLFSSLISPKISSNLQFMTNLFSPNCLLRLIVI